MDEARLLCDIDAALAADPDALGAVWKITEPDRQLDSNVVRLAPGAVVESHRGADVDVLLLVLQGAGELITAADRTDLGPHRLCWLPRSSVRELRAGPHGLVYLSVHRRRVALQVGRRP